MVLHVGTINTFDAAALETFNAVKDLKSFKQKYAPESNLILSTPVIRIDKGDANNVNKRYIDLLKGVKVDCFSNVNI